jgi:hypothetical protein
VVNGNVYRCQRAAVFQTAGRGFDSRRAHSKFPLREPIKSALGKLRVPDNLPELLDEFAFERLPVTDAHTWAVQALPPIHNDPFDRLLVAQAVCERATTHRTNVCSPS